MKGNSRQVLIRAVVTVLKPLIRVLIRNEVSHSDFSELARQAYVDVAYEHFGISGRKTTYSRVSVLTGISRKEVVRLNGLRDAQGELTRSAPNRAMRVINGWMSDSEFLNKSGLPRVLPIQGDKGSFSSLVARYSGDLTLGAVLDELERIGATSRRSGDKVRLDSHGYIPQDDEFEKIHVLATCTADLLGTGAHNLEHGDTNPRFQRQLVYSAVTDKTVEEFRIRSEAESTKLLRELNRLLSSSKKKSIESPGRKRIGLGIYYFETESSAKDKNNEN
ncbi:MAG: DUF6502 family protein [Granulosicoccus sp.]